MLGRRFRYHIFHRMTSDKARELAGPALLAAFFVAAALLVPPRAEFPINDDWDYFATVADLLHFGEIRLSDWPGMTLVAQIFWGELFAKLFGLSYWTLRVSTISMTFVGALALYFWARREQNKQVFTAVEWFIFAVAVIGAAIGIHGLATGYITI